MKEKKEEDEDKKMEDEDKKMEEAFEKWAKEQSIKQKQEDENVVTIWDKLKQRKEQQNKKQKVEKESARVRIGYGDNSEERDHQATPRSLYDPLNEEFSFDYDPCPVRVCVCH